MAILTNVHSRAWLMSFHRHGWGVNPDPTRAIHFLSLAASNSAEVESLALDAGMKKGGAAKGELVLAIFELANCFRHGWGIKKDAVAAKQYYETAANLGDTDAMNEVAWCYLEGFGCKKDKVSSSVIHACVLGAFPLRKTVVDDDGEQCQRHQHHDYHYQSQALLYSELVHGT
jgi:TPR repeat protein